MTFVPHTDAERDEMLRMIGVDSLKDLFVDIPADVRFPELDLPEGCSEPEIERIMGKLATRNTLPDGALSFLGAGTYNHYRPATVDYVLRRGEFYTAYTPYQPELSQGMLQAMFEFQSTICRLTGMDVSNASHYDGATALAEATRLALGAGHGSRTDIVMLSGVHPQCREVVATYLRGATGRLAIADDVEQAKSLLGHNTAALVVQNPNFLGRFEDVDGLADAVHTAGALMIVMADPISLGLFRPPGDYGADIVVAEGQPLGLPPSFGGPHLGIFATRHDHIRQLVGRLVGETTDATGTRGYVLTLATREQHIRRARATSNICTNSALTALGAAVYLATMGKSGLKRVAEMCYDSSHYAARQIAAKAGLPVNADAPDTAFFREFVVQLPKPVSDVNRILAAEHGITGGYDLARDDPARQNQMLVAVTEMNDRDAIDQLVEGLRHACR
jgi:glycine dehydrogenase subunit 1